jgi:flavin-dependent dehydrogenase
MSFDLAIIGAGPAGCAAALGAWELGQKVLLVEQGRFPRHKVCGEFVSAEALDLLARLVSDDVERVVLAAPRICRVRIFADGAVLEGKIDPPARSIARVDLDAALWRACALKGIEVRDQCRVAKVAGTGPFDLAVEGSWLRAKAVINASGRWSLFTSPGRRAAGPEGRLIGLKAHFQSPARSEAPAVDLYFFAGGYCGVQPVAAGAESSPAAVNVCAAVRADASNRLEDVFLRHPDLEHRSRSWTRLTDPVSTSPLIFSPAEPVASGMLQVGDAAGFVDPFVGDGISLALRSGALAAACLSGFFRRQCSLEEAHAEYGQRYRSQFARVFWASRGLRSLLRWPAPIRKPVLGLVAKVPAITRRLVETTR